MITLDVPNLFTATVNRTLKRMVLWSMILFAIPCVGQVSDTLSVGSETARQEKSYPLAIRTNLLLPFLNVGVEVPIGNRWSVGADWYYPWFPRSDFHRNCTQMDGLSVEGRYWMGKSHNRGEVNRTNRLLGHSVGVFAMGGRYDLERDFSGHRGEYVMGGIDYLFAMPVWQKRMHLEFSLGVGYFYSRATHYQVYEEGGRGYRDKNFRKIYRYVGPLKANVTLVFPLWMKQKK